MTTSNTINTITKDSENYNSHNKNRNINSNLYQSGASSTRKSIKNS